MIAFETGSADGPLWKWIASVAGGRWRRARSDGYGEILAVWSGLKLNDRVGADTDLALYLRVGVQDELHVVFGVSVCHFPHVRLFVACVVRCLATGLRLLLH